MWVLYDEAVAKPMQNFQQQKEVNKINTELINLTEELFQYGLSLIEFYSKWDKTYFPNPEEFAEEEEFYIYRANSLFVFASAFILYHEFAHVEKEHLSQINQKVVLSQERKKFEKEADDRAIDLMLQGRDGKNNKSIELGILMGLASILYFRKNVYGENTHPDTDARIKDYLEKLNPSNEEPIWGIASLFLKLWDNQFNHNFNWPKHVNDFKELFYNTLNQLEEQKIKKSN